MTTVTAADISRGDGADVRSFMGDYCRITKESIGGHAGDPLVLQVWQQQLIDRLFARRPDNRRKHRTALIGVPRKNGKTALIAGVALYGLIAEDPGAEVYSVAGDRDQAKLVFGTAKRMVELDEELSGECKTYRDAIEHRSSGSVYRALSSESPLKEGLNPTLTVVDEVHVIDEDLWNVFALARGARVDPLMVGITTAGARYTSRGMETICYRLWDYGRRVASGEVEDASFYFEWWSAPEDLDYRDPRTWGIANPGLGTILDPEALTADLSLTESEFRTKHLDQWVSSMTSVLPTGAWDECALPQRIVTKSEPIVIGFDGSWTGDSTALIGCTLDSHLFEIGAWERPADDPHWRVEEDEVDAAVERAFHDFNVLELACDPHEWRAQIQRWAAKYGRRRVQEWPTNSLDRMVPAWKEFYSAVVEQRLSHDATPGFARHVANAVLKVDQRGARPTKETKSSGRKIDRLIAAIIGWDRAQFYARKPTPKPPQYPKGFT